MFKWIKGKEVTWERSWRISALLRILPHPFDHVFLKVSIYMIFLFFFNLKVYTIYVYHSFLFPISSLPPDSFSCVPPFFLFRKQTGNKKIYQNKKIEQKHKK